MAQVLIRNLDEETLERLRQRARNRGRSLEAELRHLLTDAARKPIGEGDGLERVQELLGDRRFSDSTLLISEDRDRR